MKIHRHPINALTLLTILALVLNVKCASEDEPSEEALENTEGQDEVLADENDDEVLEGEQQDIEDEQLVAQDSVIVEPEAINFLTGCMDQYASNYDNTATFDDGTCTFASVGCAGCDLVVTANDQVLDNNILKLPKGSVIGIQAGEHKSIVIRNFYGSEDDPYIFTNCDGRAEISLSPTSEAIKIENTEHIRLTGTGSSDKRGILISAGTNGVRAYLKSSHIEVDHLEVTNVQVGIWAVTRPKCDGNSNRATFTQENTVVHDNYVHDVQREGMYLGGSFWHSTYSSNDCPGEPLYQPELRGVSVHNNIVDGTGWDGIQVGAAVEDCEIYNNTVRDYGRLNNGQHQAGFMINPGTTGKIFSNTVEGGTGVGIFCLGFDLLVHSNLVVDCANNGIHTGDRSPNSNKSYRIVNNTFVNVEGTGLYMNSTSSQNNIFYNNLLVNVNDDVFINSSNTATEGNVVQSSLSQSDFMDTDGNDFTPIEGSSLIDGGTAIPNEELSVDQELWSRVSGEAIDVGAFEVQVSEDNSLSEE